MLARRRSRWRNKRELILLAADGGMWYNRQNAFPGGDEMAVIYYADDEQALRDIVAAFLESEGHEVRTFATGDALLAAFRAQACELVLLDIMMPGSDGLAVLRALRAISTVPVILLTAKDGDGDYYSGLALGSDDYITKPFKPLLLAAKVNALLRRVRFEQDAQATPETADLCCGNLRYAHRERVFRADGRALSLTPTEMRFLHYMMAHFEEAVSRERLLADVWEMPAELESRVADETNRRLRRKLAEAGADVCVQTVWGYGFKLSRREGDA